MTGTRLTMIKELQQRPFSRPLLIWIAGILIQATFSCFAGSLLLLFFPLILILYSSFFSKQGKSCLYGSRWVWGAVFALLLLFLSIQKTAYSQKMMHEVTPVSWLRQLAREKQLQLLAPLHTLNLTEQEKSVLATLTLGYREQMDKQVKRRFSMTGVAHVLAVSGFHVAVVCGFFSFLFKIIPFRRFMAPLKFLSIIVILWVFVYITGLASSAIRAAVMLTLYLVGRLSGRSTDSYNILAASAFCMLVYDPLYLFDIGFQLSYLAVFSILYLQPRLEQLIQVRNPLLAKPYSWITVTVAAQTGTSFLCLYYFGQLSLVFLFTNLPVTLFATLLIPAGLLWMLLPAGSPGYAGLQLIVEMLTRGMLGVVDMFSRLPFAVATIRFDLFALLSGYASLFFFLLYGRNHRPKYLLMALTFVLILSVELLIGKLKLCDI